MRINIFLLGACAILMFGCSTKQTKQETAAPAVASAKQVVATAKVEAQKNEFACKRDSETRTLKVEGGQPNGCKLYYSNHSSKDPVAWSEKSNTHCEQVRSRIQGKLEEAGFKCQPST